MLIVAEEDITRGAERRSCWISEEFGMKLGLGAREGRNGEGSLIWILGLTLATKPRFDR